MFLSIRNIFLRSFYKRLLWKIFIIFLEKNLNYILKFVLILFGYFYIYGNLSFKILIKKND